VLATSIISLIALMMEAASTSETLVNLYQTTRRYNREDRHLVMGFCSLHHHVQAGPGAHPADEAFLLKIKLLQCKTEAKNAWRSTSASLIRLLGTVIRTEGNLTFSRTFLFSEKMGYVVAVLIADPFLEIFPSFFETNVLTIEQNSVRPSRHVLG
jgi:hypothetical protein